MDKQEIEELNLYTEIATSRVFEGKLFEDFVIVRALLDTAPDPIRKIPLSVFGQEFDDFRGNREEIRTFLNGVLEGRTVPRPSEVN